MNYTKLTTICGVPCVEISAGGFTASVGYAIGSNVLRLHNDIDGVEVFRYNPNNTMEDISNQLRFGVYHHYTYQIDLPMAFLKLPILHINYQ